MGVTIRGLNETIVNLARIEGKIKEAKNKAIAKGAYKVAQEAIPLTPISPIGTPTSGNLRKSQYVDLEHLEEEGFVEVGYNEEYALRQHEDLELRHTEPGTQAKFLQKPFEDNIGNIERFVANEVRKVTT